MAKTKQGVYGTTLTRCEEVLGTVIVCSGQFDGKSGEIISTRDDSHMSYLTVQVESEYKNRVYVLNLMHSQCKDIEMKGVTKW